MKEIYFKEEARDLLFSGVEKLHNAVASTMGPNGKTVITTDIHGNPEITKDGYKVSKEINFKNPIENIGATIVKEVAQLQVDQAGDGTTTAIVLANAFIQNLKDFDSNEINKAFDEIIPKVIEQLKLNSRELKREDIKYVASISANNDIQIGELIQQAYNFSNIVKVEESTNFEDKLETIDGMQLPVSYFSKHFINNERKAECELDEPSVLLIDGKIEDLTPFASILNLCAQSGKSILIITEHISEKELRKLESNVLSGNVNLCVIKTPGFGPVRKDLIRDLSDFTGAEIITSFNKPLTLNNFGKLKSCKIGKNNSLLIKHDDIDINEIVDNLNALSTSKELTTGDIDIIKKRIENLTGKVSLIKVGGGSEIEVKERKDRYDDAVLAVACALEEGIVEGGGRALYDCSYELLKEYSEVKGCAKYILESIETPIKIIDLENIINNMKGPLMYKNMFDLNIIDPLKVTRCALENAISVAKTILSTEVVILNERQWS